jgi:hypothetical protein
METVSGETWEVKRSFEDFEQLRAHMLQFHPDSLVPMLPPSSGDSDVALKKTGELIAGFLEQCFLSPSLKFAKVLSHFVRR